MNTAKIEQLFEAMRENLRIADQLKPLLTEPEAKRLMVYPDAIRQMVDDPVIRAKMETLSEGEMNKGLLHGLAALDEIKRNLEIAQLRASGNISDSMH
jgi:hypothetical protein